MARCIYRCRRKTCGAVWAIDYPEKRTYPGDYGRARIQWYRIDGTDRRYLGSEHKCQACGTTEARADQIKGSFSNHPCDERCTSARGHVCECKCGGKNHGAGWLQCTAWNGEAQSTAAQELASRAVATASNRWPATQPRLF